MHWRLIPIFGLALAVLACGSDDEPIQEQQPQEQVQPPPSPVAQATPAPEPEPEPEPISGPLLHRPDGSFLESRLRSRAEGPAGQPGSSSLDRRPGSGGPAVPSRAHRSGIDRVGG